MLWEKEGKTYYELPSHPGKVDVDFAKSLVSVVVVVVIDILMASIFLRFCLSVH